MRLRTAFLSLARERIVISEITITPQTEQTTADQVSRSGSKRYRRMSSSIPAHSSAASAKNKALSSKGRRNFTQTESKEDRGQRAERGDRQGQSEEPAVVRGIKADQKLI